METLNLTSEKNQLSNVVISDSTKAKVQTILVENNLDFDIVKLPLVGITNQTIIDNNGNPVQMQKQHQSPYYGLLNTKSGNIINSVKEGYTVTQNDEIVGIMLEGAKPFQHLLSVQKAHNINDGRKILLQLKIEGKGTVNGDTITRYLNLVDSNDGTTCLAVGVGTHTLSCENSFMKWYKGAESKLQHSQSIASRINEIPKLIELALNEADMLLNLYQKFESTKVSRDLAHKLVNSLLGFDRTSSVKELSTRNVNIMTDLYDSIETEMNSKGNNLWGLHSGVTHYTTHKKSAPKRDNGKIENIAFGSANLMNNKALEFVLQYAD